MIEYDVLPTVDFGVALRALQESERVARRGWNGKGMWLTLWPGGVFNFDESLFAHTPQLKRYAEGLAIVQSPAVAVGPTVVMKTADGSLVFGWLASQADMVADDWVILPPFPPLPATAP